MSKRHTTSPLVSPVSFSSVSGPSFSLSRKPCVSRHINSARLEPYYTRSPSTSGEEATPWYGQSFTRPAASLSWTICHMNSPSDSRKAINTPLSPTILGSRRPSLFVPTKTIPPATTALPYVCDPSWATHLTFFFALRSQLVG